MPVTDERIIVLVCDKGDDRHGEISVLDDPQKAERLVETLLEAGFEADRIHVYTGRPSEFQIRQRPVVSLAVDRQEAAIPSPGESSGQPQPASEPVAGAEPQPAQPEERGEEAPTGAVEEEPASTEPQPAEPVRFSSLFRSA